MNFKDVTYYQDSYMLCTPAQIPRAEDRKFWNLAPGEFAQGIGIGSAVINPIPKNPFAPTTSNVRPVINVQRSDYINLGHTTKCAMVDHNKHSRAANRKRTLAGFQLVPGPIKFNTSRQLLNISYSPPPTPPHPRSLIYTT